MAKVLLGSMAKYYAWRGAEPYLSFDGVNDYCKLSSNYSLQIGDEVIFDDVYLVPKNEAVPVYKLCDSIDALGSRFDININGNNQKIDERTYADIYVNGVLNGFFYPYINNHVRAVCKEAGRLVGVFGVRGSLDIVSYFKGNIGGIRLNGYSYINQGDQNGNNILPSTPSGANGTISGAGWKYVGIDGHYETVALLNAWIASTTITEPLQVILLEPMDTSTIPASKDGWAISVQVGYPGGGVFGYNTMNLNLSLGL